MVQAALQTAQEFSLQKAADRYLDLYETICRVSSNEMALNDAMPLFISQPPSPVRARILRWIADSAAFTYSALARSACSFGKIGNAGK
jgi:hypothetical protein